VKKGPLAEALVVQCLREHGWPFAERRVQGGQHDRGDVAGIPGVVIEVKNQAKMTLAEWVDEARRESCEVIQPHSCPSWFWNGLAVVWHKRRGKGDPLDWYVTMTGRDFLALLAEYTKGEA
jgi:hypothetical protein